MPLNPRLTDWHNRSVWLIGASSGLGLATAQALHAGLPPWLKYCPVAQNGVKVQYWCAVVELPPRADKGGAQSAAFGRWQPWRQRRGFPLQPAPRMLRDRRRRAVRAIDNSRSRKGGGLALRISVFRLPPTIETRPLRRAYSYPWRSTITGSRRCSPWPHRSKNRVTPHA